MTIQFTIYNQKATSYISSDGIIKAEVSLLEKSDTTFLDYIGSKPKCDVASSTVGENLSKTSTILTNLVSLPASNSDKTIVHITYTITDKTTNFVSEIGKNFYNNLPSLSFSVSLQEAY